MKFKRKISSILLLITLITASAQAQINCGKPISPNSIAFDEGESISYTVSYSSAIISTDVADVDMSISSEKIHGVDCFKIYAVGRTRPFYSIFFEMEDVYTSWLDKSTLRPMRITSNLKEGGYRYRTAFDYSWDKMSVRTHGHNVKRNVDYIKTLPLQECSYDALALFYNMRCVDASNMKIGQRQTLQIVLEDTIRTIQFRLLARDRRKIDKIGTFKTLKFACQLATEVGESFEDGTEFFVWISDDRNHIPIYLESPIRVGSVKATLSKWSGLKYPFESVILGK